MKLPKSISNILQPIVSQFSNPKPNSLLYNRWVLYFVFIISIFQLYTFSVAGKLQNIAIFLIVAFLTSFFSKNMTVIMVIALVFTELMNAGFKNSRFEGMTEGPENNPTEKQPTATTDEPATPPTEENKDKPDKKVPLETPDNQPTPEEVKNVQKELQENQQKILDGFQQIEPYMNKAEGLVERMNSFAKA